MTISVTSVETLDVPTVAPVIVLACLNNSDVIDVGAASVGSTGVAVVSIGVDGALTVTLMVSTGSGRVVVCKLLDLGHAVLGQALQGQRDWDMLNWDSFCDSLHEKDVSVKM